uniref:Uncharacterized protein n=1 Tax=Timema bartmani TaxID=61472 RepID=A0A7R9ETK7_9NEOP|nr:unnamed protein product [Timema bartmani]
MQSSRGFGNHGYGKLRAMRLSRDVGYKVMKKCVKCRHGVKCLLVPVLVAVVLVPVILVGYSSSSSASKEP